MKLFYPVLMFLAGQKKGKLTGDARPNRSFYLLSATLNNGSIFNFDALRGKKVMIVNSASNCGYTPQYRELQDLADRFPTLKVLVFPSNDFKNQESGTDEEIEAFCRINYGLSLPIFKKSVVIRSPSQSEVFEWLTTAALNGWNDTAPSWNFNKYLINEEGILTHIFAQSISPLSKEVIDAIEL